MVINARHYFVLQLLLLKNFSCEKEPPTFIMCKAIKMQQFFQHCLGYQDSAKGSTIAADAYCGVIKVIRQT